MYSSCMRSRVKLLYYKCFPLYRRSGPQGNIKPFTVVDDPAAWYSKQWVEDKSWVYQLTEQVFNL